MPTLWEMPIDEVEQLRDGLKQELEAHLETTITSNLDDWTEIQEIYQSQIDRYQAEIDRRLILGANA